MRYFINYPKPNPWLWTKRTRIYKGCSRFTLGGKNQPIFSHLIQKCITKTKAHHSPFFFWLLGTFTLTGCKSYITIIYTENVCSPCRFIKLDAWYFTRIPVHLVIKKIIGLSTMEEKTVLFFFFPKKTFCLLMQLVQKLRC